MNQGFIMNTYIMDTSAWVTQPERLENVKDNVNRPKIYLKGNLS